MDRSITIRYCFNPSCGTIGAAGDSPLKKCGRCKFNYYCSIACQRAHYPQHKDDCLEMAANDTVRLRRAHQFMLDALSKKTPDGGPNASEQVFLDFMNLDGRCKKRGVLRAYLGDGEATMNLVQGTTTWDSIRLEFDSIKSRNYKRSLHHRDQHTSLLVKLVNEYKPGVNYVFEFVTSLPDNKFMRTLGRAPLEVVEHQHHPPEHQPTYTIDCTNGSRQAYVDSVRRQCTQFGFVQVPEQLERSLEAYRVHGTKFYSQVMTPSGTMMLVMPE